MRYTARRDGAPRLGQVPLMILRFRRRLHRRAAPRRLRAVCLDSNRSDGDGDGDGGEKHFPHGSFAHSLQRPRCPLFSTVVFVVYVVVVVVVVAVVLGLVLVLVDENDIRSVVLVAAAAAAAATSSLSPFFTTHVASALGRCPSSAPNLSKLMGHSHGKRPPH